MTQTEFEYGSKERRGKRGPELARKMIEGGVLALPAYGNPSVLMIEPPLVISSVQIDAVLYALSRALKKLESPT